MMIGTFCSFVIFCRIINRIKSNELAESAMHNELVLIRLVILRLAASDKIGSA